MTDPHEDLVEAVARAICKADGTAQCAAICLSHFAISTTAGKCPEAPRIWGHKARAVLALIAERTKDATPEMRRIWIGATDEIWHTMHRASALWPKEKP